MNKTTKIIIIVAIIVALVVFFFPKPAGQTSLLCQYGCYECSCAGFKIEYRGAIGIPEKGPNTYCLGIPFSCEYSEKNSELTNIS